MLGKNLKLYGISRQYLWLMMVGLSLGISSLILQAYLNQIAAADLPSQTRAMETSLLNTASGFRQVLRTLEDIDRQQRRQYQPSQQFQGRIIDGVQLPSSQKVIALTFDDGPWPQTTAKMLDILQAHDVNATFFVLGSNIIRFPDLLKRVAQDGHAIGNHTWSHHYRYHSPALAQREIQLTSQVIEKHTGFKTRLFRPPGGYLDNGLVAYARTQGQTTVMWTVDDTYSGTVEQAVNNVIQNATPGGIVLMHDGGGDRQLMIQALPHIITQLKQQGYQFVTVPQLLDMADKLEQ
ncbi:polysaccharide deacetylase family protein [Acaryochloris sp. IP29b_bin.148]|uniref:polysaccharide deacetylase family protein n=1 Tax=Acaryochloris sp. IP29b_bin.148 TaxID=2969218 RepID=UPI0026041892|nr:polysaccharide deacetylase family protein [Acaryochloris sp. IP29b_bin.148]